LELRTSGKRSKKKKIEELWRMSKKGGKVEERTAKKGT
jgi:hypothetical protein